MGKRILHIVLPGTDIITSRGIDDSKPFKDQAESFLADNGLDFDNTRLYVTEPDGDGLITYEVIDLLSPESGITASSKG